MASRSGTGDIRNEILVNTNGGRSSRSPWARPQAHIIIASGGTRGDLATVDSNNGTLLADAVGSDRPPDPAARGEASKAVPPATTTGNTVEGNLIGLGSDGKTPPGNGGNGVMMSAGATGNTIGGTLAGQGNTIAANKSNGVGDRRSGNLDQRRSREFDRDRRFRNRRRGQPLRWCLDWRRVSSDRVADNTIANNTLDGVGLYATAVGNSIQANRIYGNKGLGINRGSGSNNGQSFPVLSAAFASANASYVVGTAAGIGGSLLTIDFYANTARIPPGTARASSTSARRPSRRDRRFQTLLPVGANPGEWMSATATSASGDTSGFSADIVVGQVHTSAMSHQLSQHLDRWPED